MTERTDGPARPSPAHTPTGADLGELPTAVTAIDRLVSVYSSDGPYTSLYMALGDTVEGRFDRRILVMLDDLRGQGAPAPAIAALEARLALPPPEDVAAVGIVAGADGTTIVDYGLEPPFQDHGVVETLPHAAPLLEWHQHRIPHLVLTLDATGGDLAMFGLDHFSRLERLDADDEIVARAAQVCQDLRIELVILTGESAHTAALADALIPQVDVTCRVVVEPQHDTVDDLVDATVRLVNDTAARRTVALLREHRFLDEHEAAVDGRTDTVAELSSGAATQVLVHGSPMDEERIWIGELPAELSTVDRPGYRSARLVDAVIWSAVLQNVPVHIIPSTGPAGPEADIAAMTDDQPQFSE